jgi:hypothetical protein
METKGSLAVSVFPCQCCVLVSPFNCAIGWISQIISHTLPSPISGSDRIPLLDCDNMLIAVWCSGNTLDLYIVTCMSDYRRVLD